MILFVIVREGIQRKKRKENWGGETGFILFFFHTRDWSWLFEEPQEGAWLGWIPIRPQCEWSNNANLCTRRGHRDTES